MAFDIIKFAFVGGEVAENYYGRSDLEKFDLALAEAENWFVDYHGGLSTAPGLEMVDNVQNDEYDTKFFTFKFSSSIANTNLILFGKDYIRFVQDGAYVLEGEKTIDSITQAATGVMGITAHGYVEGDWIKPVDTGEMVELFNRNIQVGTVLTADTFEMLDAFGQSLDTTNFTPYVSGGLSARIYTLVSPYLPEHLIDLRCHQIRDVLRFTHVLYPVRNLIRNDSADWTLEIEDVTSTLEVPVITSATPITGSTYSVAYVVTQVNADGIESSGSDYFFLHTTVGDNNPNNSIGVLIAWNTIVGASYYNVYKTRVVEDATAISRSYQVGFIGQSKGSRFMDVRITPDFAKTPPRRQNPFADSPITAVNVIAGGSGYTNASVLTVTDPNPDAGGFIGYAIIGTTVASAAGPVVGIDIADGGHGYTNPTFSLTIGAGAVLEGETGEPAGNYPAISTVNQQRQIYAATINQPLTVFGSHPGQLSNFGVSEIVVANDAFEHEIDSEDASTLRHIIPTRGGLLVFNAAGIWLMFGSQGRAITATDVQADPQAFKGASPVPPVKINTEILYCEGTGGKVMLLSYNDVAKLYAGVDLSLLASHLISDVKQITHWAYADEPFKQVWARRQDGVMLNFTIIREQEIFAWSRRLTRGDFMDVASLEEENNSTVYIMTRRNINGRHTKFIEKVARRNFTHVEDAFCVDCGLRLGSTYPDADIQIAAITGNGVTVVASAPVFVSGDVGKVIRACGGKMNVATFVSAFEITVNIIRDLWQFVPFTDPAYPKIMESGDWTMDTPVTTISGLHHLEGEAVAVLADGNVINGLTVSSGIITLPVAATRVIIGLKYVCKARNLPMNIQGAVIENKRKRVLGLAMRLKDTRGLKAGNELDDLNDIKDREGEAYGEPTVLLNGMTNLSIEPVWGEEGQSYLVQEDPLPATVLGYVLETETGDDTK